MAAARPGHAHTSSSSSGSGKPSATFKLLMLGDSAVGKSCLTQRFAKGDASSMSLGTTMGVELAAKTVAIGGTLVRLQVWDTAGQERFRALAASYYRGAQGVMLCYDVTRRDSFANISRWLSIMSEHDLEQEACIVLIGNKCDLASERQVSTAAGRDLAAARGIPFFETSAMSNLHVEDAFMTLARAVYTRLYGAVAGEDAAAAGKQHKTPAPREDHIRLHDPPPESPTAAARGAGGSGCPC